MTLLWRGSRSGSANDLDGDANPYSPYPGQVVYVADPDGVYRRDQAVYVADLFKLDPG